MCIESLNCSKNSSYFCWPCSAEKRNGYTFLTQTSWTSGWLFKIDMTCMSAAPAALHRYLAAVPAMSLIPFAPFIDVELFMHRIIKLLKEGIVFFLVRLTGVTQGIDVLNANFLRSRLGLKEVHHFGDELL